MTQTDTARAASGIVLATLASGQFLMTLDSAVMNVSIATVASDVGTTVTGIQTAITLYTLVMAALMITGGKIGEIIGRKRAFSIGCVIYGCGSFTTSIAPNLTVLIIGWSFLEGIGAALIMPAIVALVASNFGRADRPRAYGLVASAGAIAVAAGPLIGGLFTTYASWRWVFACEVIVVAGILALSRRMVDAEPASPRPRLDLVGTVLSATSLALIVLGVLKSGEWGLITAKAGAPDWFGLSPVVWMILGGGVVMWGFLVWERRRIDTGNEPLVDPELLEVEQLRGGLISFFFQYLLQAGLFFAVPLFLSVALGLSAIATGVRLLPLSITLLLAAVGIPKLFPKASPRLVVQLGFVALLVGLVVFIAALEAGAGPEIVTWPMLLAGLGIGALASQLGAVTVSAVSDEETGQVGGIQNTVTNLGASIGTALAGAALIAALTSSFLSDISENPDVPADVAASAEVSLAGGIPFVSDAELEEGLEEAGVDPVVADAVLESNEEARIDALRVSLGILALVAVLALFATRRLPRTPAGSAAADARVSSGRGRRARSARARRRARCPRRARRSTRRRIRRGTPPGRSIARRRARG